MIDRNRLITPRPWPFMVRPDPAWNMASVDVPPPAPDLPPSPAPRPPGTPQSPPDQPPQVIDPPVPGQNVPVRDPATPGAAAVRVSAPRCRTRPTSTQAAR
jgi:hypothetical protein